MPPVRTITVAKPLKTERTHEENQERAYIAASRRSDRSLEARIESARRASEIHKKRTGRALRVTEQDVVNEEMYEEEDEDLPAQYRRLTAHLQTTSGDFNRRLQAYLTTQYATRAALLEQGANSTWMQPYPHTPQFSYNTMAQPMVPQMLPPQMIHHSPHTYRQSPYPMSSNPGFRSHARPASTVSPDMSGHQQSYSATTSPVEPRFDEQGRTSLPAQSLQTTPQPQQATQIRPSVSRTGSGVPAKEQSPQANIFNGDVSQAQQQQPMSAAYPYPMQMQTFDPTSQTPNFSPFTTAMPLESTQLLMGGAIDPMNPYNSFLMPANEINQQPFYSYNPNPNPVNKAKRARNPASDGMQQTLAPGTTLGLDTSATSAHAFSTPPSATTDGITTPFSSTYGFNFDGPFVDALKAPSLTRNNSFQASGAVTPTGNADWTSLIEGWEEPTAV